MGHADGVCPAHGVQERHIPPVFLPGTRSNQEKTARQIPVQRAVLKIQREHLASTPRNRESPETRSERRHRQEELRRLYASVWGAIWMGSWNRKETLSKNSGNPSNYRLQWIMLHQCQLLNCDKCTTVMWTQHQETGSGFMGALCTILRSFCIPRLFHNKNVFKI